jgi:hypothetical protein
VREIVRPRGRLRARAVRGAVPLAAIALLASACGTTPGTATEVNGTRITTAEVQELAGAQCDLRKQLVKNGQAPAASASRVRQESLEVLMDTELSHQFGESEGIKVNPALAKALFEQVKPLFEPLPEQSRNVFLDVFEGWSEGRAILVQAGGEALGQPVSPTNIQQALDAGVQARESWLEDADIKTDPSFAPGKDGFPSYGSGSASRAVSDFAKGSAAQEQDPAWVNGLPAKQKCG